MHHEERVSLVKRKILSVLTIIALSLSVFVFPPTTASAYTTVYGTKCTNSSCTHGLESTHYYNDSYGYVGTSSSFKAYSLSVTSLCDDYTVTSISVSGATTTSAAIEGKKVTIKYTINNYNEATAIYTTNKTGTVIYYRLPRPGIISFIMPARDVTINIGKSFVTMPTTVSIKTATTSYDETVIYSDDFDTDWHVRINGVEYPSLVPSFENSYLGASLSGLSAGDVYTVYSDPIHFYDDGYIIINTYDYDDMDTIYCAYGSNGKIYPGRYSGYMNVIRIPKKGDYTITFERVMGDAPNTTSKSTVNNCKIFVIGTTDKRSIDSSEIVYTNNNTAGLPNLYKLRESVSFDIELKKEQTLRFEFISCGMYWSSSYKPQINILCNGSEIEVINLDNRTQSTGVYEFIASETATYSFTLDSSIGGTLTGTDNGFYVCRLVASDYKGSEQILNANLSSTSMKYGATAPTLSVTGAKTSLTYTSSNPSVVTVSSSGAITLKGIGTTIITITAAETDDWIESSTTATLTVSKGDLTAKIKPTAGLINYGQQLSASNLSGGTAINASGSSVGGGMVI